MKVVPNGSWQVPARWVMWIMVAILAPLGYAVVTGAAHQGIEGHPVIVERVMEIRKHIDAFRAEQNAQTRMLNEIATTVRVIDERTKRSK